MYSIVLMHYLSRRSEYELRVYSIDGAIHFFTGTVLIVAAKFKQVDYFFHT